MSIAVGIDVAEARKGLDLVAIDQSRRVIEAIRRATINDVAGAIARLAPAVVCIDSPPGWALNGRTRAAERHLRRFGITAFSTPTDPGTHAFYRWMRVGFAVYAAIADAYPLFRGGSVHGTAVEVFPEASAVLLAQRLRPADEPKVLFRRGVLEQHGVDCSTLATVDALDAALAALTGVMALNGSFSVVGSPAEGVIVLPVPDLPNAPLLRFPAIAGTKEPGGDGATARAGMDR
jgi:predicted nuclease with RNAse H fold